MEIWLIIIAGFIIWAVWPNSSDKEKRSKKSKKKGADTGLTIRMSFGDDDDYSYPRKRSKNKAPGRWLTPSEPFKVDKYEIKGGWVYFGGVLDALNGYATEASLIDDSLKVNSKSPDTQGAEMGYWPSYDSISPRLR